MLSCVAGLSSCVLRVSGGSAYRHRRKQKKKGKNERELLFFFFSFVKREVSVHFSDYCYYRLLFFFSFPCTCLYDAARDTLASSFSCLRRVGFRNKTVVALEQNCTAKKKKRTETTVKGGGKKRRNKSAHGLLFLKHVLPHLSLAMSVALPALLPLIYGRLLLFSLVAWKKKRNRRLWRSCERLAYHGTFLTGAEEEKKKKKQYLVLLRHVPTFFFCQLHIF